MKLCRMRGQKWCPWRPICGAKTGRLVEMGIRNAGGTNTPLEIYTYDHLDNVTHYTYDKPKPLPPLTQSIAK